MRSKVIIVVWMLFSCAMTIQAQEKRFEIEGKIPGIWSDRDSVDFATHIDPLYFILGTLADYNTGSMHKRDIGIVDYYSGGEETTMNFFMEFMEKWFGISFTVEEGYRDKILNEDFSNKVRELLGDRPRDINFSNNDQRYSYLAGCFLRYGWVEDEDIYYISLHNSYIHKHLLGDVFKDLACPRYNYSIYLGHIPTGCTFYFQPTAAMKLVFEPFMGAVKVRNKKMTDFIDSMVDEHEELRHRESERRLNKIEAIKLLWGLH